MDRFIIILFPSPCGVRRVRDGEDLEVCYQDAEGVSVPLRGKEGAGLSSKPWTSRNTTTVSVPLRGKEGAGPNYEKLERFDASGFRPLAG